MILTAITVGDDNRSGWAVIQCASGVIALQPYPLDGEAYAMFQLFGTPAAYISHWNFIVTDLLSVSGARVWSRE